MKRKYERPLIVYDSFEMSTDIAGNCELQANFQHNQCTATNRDGVSLFGDGITSASCRQWGGVEICELWSKLAVCWNNWTSSNNVFSS